jgi:hypothetical protein
MVPDLARPAIFAFGADRGGSAIPPRPLLMGKRPTEANPPMMATKLRRMGRDSSGESEHRATAA